MDIRRTPWWLWFSVPITVLAVAGSVTGILVDRVYVHETAEWAAEAIGQDITNLVAFPVLGLFGALAARGSVPALLAWLGLLAYSTYTYAIYVFAVHFGPLFLLDVAVFGLSAWALLGALASVDADQVRDRLRPTQAAAAGAAAGLLLALAGVFALLWLGEDLQAMVEGSVPESLTRSGLTTNPVHVLDLSLFLPAAVVAGWSLHRRRPRGYVLAPAVLTAMTTIGVGIVSSTVVLAARGEETSLAVAGVIGSVSLVEGTTVWRLLQSARTGHRERPGVPPARLDPRPVAGAEQ